MKDARLLEADDDLIDPLPPRKKKSALKTGARITGFVSLILVLAAAIASITLLVIDEDRTTSPARSAPGTGSQTHEVGSGSAANVVTGDWYARELRPRLETMAIENKARDARIERLESELASQRRVVAGLVIVILASFVLRTFNYFRRKRGAK